jgi:hypothetical protein
MAEMGRYCKAYPLQRFRQFDGWSEKSENARREQQESDGQESNAPRPLADETILYLQENLVVTDGIMKDEHVIYDNITPEWVEFCTTELNFVVPNYEADDVETETAP